MRRLAEHIEGKDIALVFEFAGALHGGGDGFAENEMFPHDAHGLAHRRADHRLAQPVERFLGGAHHPAERVLGFDIVQPGGGQHQRAG